MTCEICEAKIEARINDEITHEQYDEMLDEVCEEVKIGNLTYSPSHVLKNVDPIAYRVGFSEYLDNLLSDAIYEEGCTCDEEDEDEDEE